MSYVFVVDTDHRPLDPVHPGHARRLLAQRQAAVWRRYPFTLILKRAGPDAAPTPLRLKIDPGSRTTGLALVTDGTEGTGETTAAEPAEPDMTTAADTATGNALITTGRVGRVVWAGELTHRGQAVHDGLVARRAIRRSRRQRHTRYRPQRFANRHRPDDWLPPSRESRLANVETWVRRLGRLANVVAFSQELVRFDAQALQNPEIAGVEYQQGTLAGYELREYLLEKWQRRCAYCQATGVPLQIEHIVPKARQGSDRASNLTLACGPCNQRKGTLTAEEFGHPEIQVQAKLPLKDAAAVNTTRWALYRQLMATGLPVETGAGGRTKWNRTRRGLPKTHWLDAACVGASTPERLATDSILPVRITAVGRHARQLCRMDKYGFPRTGPKATSVVGGLRTGDLVRAVVPAPSVKAGTYVGRLAVRASGSCNITTARQGVVQGVHVRHCRPLHRSDGYRYAVGRDDAPHIHTTSTEKGEAALPPHA